MPPLWCSGFDTRFLENLLNLGYFLKLLENEIVIEKYLN